MPHYTAETVFCIPIAIRPWENHNPDFHLKTNFSVKFSAQRYKKQRRRRGLAPTTFYLLSASVKLKDKTETENKGVKEIEE